LGETPWEFESPLWYCNGGGGNRKDRNQNAEFCLTRRRCVCIDDYPETCTFRGMEKMTENEIEQLFRQNVAAIREETRHVAIRVG
jgi:hypothetical protein